MMMPGLPMQALTMQSLGTQVSAQGDGAFASLREVSRLEALLRRFHPSPFTQLNREGLLHRPPVDLVRALGHALDIARQTCGLVTPTILPALEAAGYTAAPGAGAVREPQAVPDITGLHFTADVIRLPAGMRLDLGGTAKSWIAREAFCLLSGDALLDAGGDLILRRREPSTIGIRTPHGPPLYLNLPPGLHGVATSSVLRRAWAGGHHLIDPRTGSSADTPFVQVTAVTTHVTDAEILTKLALLNATDVLNAWLERLPDSRLLAFDQGGHWERWAA